MRIFVWLMAALVGVASVVVPPARAASLSLIRDAEIENTIRAFSTPLFRAAGLNPSDVQIHLINDRSLNAFVAGGQRLFINTGLLLQSKHAGQVIGVIAHEIGHIAGGHLARLEDELKKASAQQILALLLGGAAGIGTGRGDVAGVVIAGGSGSAVRGLLQFSRTQESSADGAAMSYLDGAGISSRGLLEFMEILGTQELLSVDRQDPYLRTHPLTRERIATLREHVARSPHTDKSIPPDFAAWHRRMKAKLLGFLYPLGHTLQQYPESDNSLEGRYARAVAYYRVPDLDRALPLIDGLIAEHPSDPYFHEIKGQMLFENGRGPEAVAPYERAVRLSPNSALLRGDLARIQIEINDPALLDPAIGHLRAALHADPTSPFNWRQLAIAFGRKGDMANSSLALAEEAILNNKPAEARYHAGRAEQMFPRGSPGWIQAQDILEQARLKQNQRR
jgi:predicted Zn-dependent protease